MAKLAAGEAFLAVASDVANAITLEASFGLSGLTVATKMAGLTAVITTLLISSLRPSFRTLVRYVPNLATNETLCTRLLLATGTVAADVTGFITDVAEAIVLGAVASHVASLGAVIARGFVAARGRSSCITVIVGAVPTDVARFVAHVADAVRLWAIPRHMSRLGAVVARIATTDDCVGSSSIPHGGSIPDIRGRGTVPGDVTNTITPVATIINLLAVTGKVTRSVALVALLSRSRSCSSYTYLRWTFSCKMSHAIAFVAL